MAGGPASTSRSELCAGLLCFTGPPFSVKKATMPWCCHWKIVVCLWLTIFWRLALGMVKHLLIQWLSINWHSSLPLDNGNYMRMYHSNTGIATFHIDLCRVSSISFFKVTCLSCYVTETTEENALFSYVFFNSSSPDWCIPQKSHSPVTDPHVSFFSENPEQHDVTRCLLEIDGRCAGSLIRSADPSRARFWSRNWCFLRRNCWSIPWGALWDEWRWVNSVDFWVAV